MEPAEFQESVARTLESVLNTLEDMHRYMNGVPEKLDSLDGYVRNHLTSKMEKDFDGVPEKLDSLDGYVRNYLTSKMEQGFDEVKNGLVKASILFQDHEH